uniref:Uncharacterized protein n=1 Tax=Anguilla anguilla TaxID=7936 RepID=A0A0E9UDE4_ANGAN
MGNRLPHSLLSNPTADLAACKDLRFPS